MRRQLLRILTGLFFTASVSASNLSANDWYLSIVLSGYSSVDAEFSTYDIDREGNSVSLGAMVGHRVLPVLSVEGGYLDLGDYDGSFNNNGNTITESLSPSGWTGGLKLFTPQNWKWGAYARAGWIWWDSDSSLDSSNPSFAGDDNGYDPYFGAGITRRYLNNGLIQFGATRYEIGNLTLDTAMLELIALY